MIHLGKGRKNYKVIVIIIKKIEKTEKGKLLFGY